MKKVSLGLLLITTMAVGLYSQTIDKPVATIYLAKPALISLNQLQLQIDILESRFNNDLSDDDIRKVLDAMIDNVLIDQAASEKSILATDTEIDGRVNEYRASIGQNVTDEMFLSIIESQVGMTYYEFREQVRLDITRQKYVFQERESDFGEIQAPTEGEINQFYARNIQNFIQPEAVLLDHVFFAAEATDPVQQRSAKERAQLVVEEIRSQSISFQDGVAKYSQDASTKLKGGRIGYLTINDANIRQIFGDSFVDTVFSLEIEAVSPVVQSLIGFHIVKVADHLPARLLALDDAIPPENLETVSEIVARSLISNRQAEVYQNAIADVTRELRDRAEILIYSEALAELS